MNLTSLVPHTRSEADELHVRCLALDDGTNKLGFAVVNSVGVPREIFDEARKRIQGKLKEEVGRMDAQLKAYR